MADKNTRKIKKSEAMDVSDDDDVIVVEPPTPVHQIRDVSFEQFTKVNIFLC